ncbi:hypothetical protein [Kiloniella majae]|uniref:hypothetical protein n=1 Tax=Kiloniella majae TaxID=1938558 RepID=UPI000A2770B2|nr:hypothetical protein [Kiloniella majae]
MKKLTQSSWGIICISLCLTLFVSIDFWEFIAKGYEGDSFYTLELLESLGVIAITIILSFSVLFLALKKSYLLYQIAKKYNERLEIITFSDIALNLIIFSLFIWLSPQIYYAYYYIIFDGLPIQIVIKKFPDFLALTKVITLTDKANLSLHGQGLLGRTFIIQPLALYFIVTARKARK